MSDQEDSLSRRSGDDLDVDGDLDEGECAGPAMDEFATTQVSIGGRVVETGSVGQSLSTQDAGADLQFFVLGMASFRLKPGSALLVSPNGANAGSAGTRGAEAGSDSEGSDVFVGDDDEGAELETDELDQSSVQTLSTGASSEVSPGTSAQVSPRASPQASPETSPRSKGRISPLGRLLRRRRSSKKWRELTPAEKVAAFDASLLLAHSKAHVKISSLWVESPVLIVMLRRFGCPICRYTAARMSTMYGELARLGVKMVAIGLERKGVDEFLEANYFKGDIYIDEKKEVYKALRLRRTTLLGAMTKRVRKTFKLAQIAHIPGNLVGDGLQLGGVFIIGPGGEIILEHVQRDAADFPRNSKIFKAVGGDPDLAPQLDRRRVNFEAGRVHFGASNACMV